MSKVGYQNSHILNHLDSRDSFISQTQVRLSPLQYQKKFLSCGYDLDISIIRYEEVTRENKKYISYTIQIKTIGKQYYIEKRYSDFKSLQKRMQKKHQHYRFNDFPKTTYLGRFDAKVLEDRCKRFNLMLEYLIKLLRILPSSELFEFVELPTKLELPNAPIKGQRFCYRESYLNVFRGFLDRLNFSKHENFMIIVTELKEFLIQGEMKITEDCMSLLLLGDSVRTGLMKLFCEKRHKELHLACCPALKFLLDLFNPCFYSLGSTGLSVFRKLEPDKFIKMGLKSHLETDGLKKCKPHAYQLLLLYCESRPNFQECCLFSSESKYKNYQRWKNRQIYTSTHVEKHHSNIQTNIFFGTKPNRKDSLFANPPLRKRLKRGSSKAYDSVAEFLSGATNLYKNRGTTELHIHSHPMHEDKLAAVLIISNDSGMTPTLPQFLNSKFSNLISGFELKHLIEPSGLISFKVKPNPKSQTESVFKGRYKKTQNENSILFEFASQEKRRGSSGSDFHNHTQSTIAEDSEDCPDMLKVLFQIEFLFSGSNHMKIQRVAGAAKCLNKMTIDKVMKSGMFEQVFESLKNFILTFSSEM